MKKGEQTISYALILPALIFVGMFLIIPMFQNVYYSFFKWDGISEPIFIGLDNFKKFFVDENFLVSMRNTVIWVAFTIVFPVLGGLVIAVFFKGLSLEGFFKSVFFIPYTVSFVATGLIWTFMFSKDLGVINGLFSMVSIEAQPSWLTQVPLNTIAMLIAWTWQQLGLNMVLFLMGLATIPTDPFEAAYMEGANKWQIFRHITLPMLRPITTVVVTMAMVNSFKTFDIIYVMTRGGPYRSSETLAVTMFRETFTMFNMGYGAAISILLSIIVIGISVVYIRRMTHKEQFYY